jgi:hypothetical protein
MVCSVVASEAQQSPGNPERLISAAIEIASSLHPRNDQDQNRQIQDTNRVVSDNRVGGSNPSALYQD